ncbi:hypothetical protein GCM10009799_20580 [Nocardiopsis rhodophaea]|uniref:Head-to-tail adaptor n=1 Tax=Nocardiopsis rhodophaea TaxID=280238 RepID=A0ABN2SZL6_9ACTN
MAYATVTELEDYLGHTVEGAGRMLDRASRLVDRELISAVYDPAAPDVVEALRSATLEQCADWDEAGTDGTEAGDPDRWSSVSAGSVSLSRGSRETAGSASTTVRLCHQARLILQQAGLTSHAPQVGRW